LGITEERHGGEWHMAMINLIKNYFKQIDFEVINEPPLNYGKADLGVYKKGHSPLYVEIGSTSLFKVWYNLHSMPGVIFLFVPSIYGAVEFKTPEG